MTIREIDGRALQAGGRAALGHGRRARSASSPGSRRSARDRTPHEIAPASSMAARFLQWSTAALVVAQALVVGLQVDRPARPASADSVDRGDRAPAARVADVHRRHRGAAARQHPRVTALVRLLSRCPARASIAACGSCSLGFFLASSSRPSGSPSRAPASVCRPAASRARAISARAAVALLLMFAVLRRSSFAARARAVWRDRSSLAWSLGAAGIVDRLGARAAPGRRRAARRARRRLPRHRGARRAARVHAGPDVADLPARHRRRQPDHPADQDSRRRRLVRAAGDPALHPRRRADGIGRHLRAHRRSRHGHRRPRARRPGDGGRSLPRSSSPASRDRRPPTCPRSARCSSRRCGGPATRDPNR